MVMVMVMGGSALERVAARLGLHHQLLIGKANEYERLLKLKFTTSNKISDSVQAIICLDFATLLFNDSFDSDLALKLAGVKKLVYANYKRTIGKLLGIDHVIDVNSLCVQFGCGSNVHDLAVNILNYYREHTPENSDCNHPQYPCMAVYKASKLEKVKISKSKFLASSRLKLAQWNDLDAKWTKITEKANFCTKTESLKTKTKNKDDASSITNDTENTIHQQRLKEKCVSDENYETWKSRILERAYKEIANLDENIAFSKTG